MIKRFLVFGLVSIFLLSFGVYCNSYAQAKESLPSLGKAPDFSLQDVYLNNYKLSAYKKKMPVLLFFWTTWCPFCQKELMVLNSQLSLLTDAGIEALSINVGEDTNKVQAYSRNNNISLKVLLDTDTGVSRSYGVAGVPTYVLIDKEGNIVFKDNSFPEKEYKVLVGK
jgi:peroxiredoxin